MQTEVAEKADISNNFYSNIERGKTKPSVETVFKICRALDLSLDGIIFEKKSMKEVYLQETLKDFEKILQDNDAKSIENTIEFCNVLSAMLKKIKMIDKK